MSSLSDAFDQPVSYTEDGLNLSLPKLDIDDHIKWCKELYEQQKPIKLKSIPGNLPPAERARQQRAVEFDEPALDEILDLIYTPAGMKTAIDKSLEKMGMSDPAERAKTIKRIKPSRARSLAMEVSGLFEKRAVATTDQTGGATPLSGAGASGGGPTSTSTTGAGQDSSSPST